MGGEGKRARERPFMGHKASVRALSYGALCRGNAWPNNETDEGRSLAGSVPRQTTEGGSASPRFASGDDEGEGANVRARIRPCTKQQQARSADSPPRHVAGEETSGLDQDRVIQKEAWRRLRARRSCDELPETPPDAQGEGASLGSRSAAGRQGEPCGPFEQAKEGFGPQSRRRLSAVRGRGTDEWSFGPGLSRISDDRRQWRHRPFIPVGRGGSFLGLQSLHGPCL